jgi:potassium-dependent mechanosensitive channel
MKKNTGHSLLYPSATGLILLLNVILLSLSSSAQQQDTIRPVAHTDSTKPGFVERMKKFGGEEIVRSIATFKAARNVIKQDQLLESIVKTSLQAKNYLKAGIDSFAINTALNELKNDYEIISDGVFVNKGTGQTNRNLAISSQLLRELIYKTELEKNKLDKYYKDVVRFRFTIDSLSSDSALYDFPDDSAAIENYRKKIIVSANTLLASDSLIKKNLVNVQLLQTKVNLELNQYISRLEEIEHYRKELSDHTFKRDFPNLGDSISFERPISEIISFSRAKGKMMLWFYISDNPGKIFCLLILIILATFFLNSLKENINKEGLLRTDSAGQLVFRYPFLSAVMIVLNLFQFIFIDPPFIFNVWFWIISAACLTVIFRGFISRFWMTMWLTMLFLFILACADNAILQASRTERWYMLVLAIAGILSGSSFLLRGHKKELKEKSILYFIAFVVLMSFISVITNIYGRYNLSKTMLNSGYFNLIIAILFLWTIRLINEALYHASEVYKRPEKKLFYINFSKVGQSAPGIFYMLMVVGWFILVARNFYAYKELSGPFEDFLFSERKIGDYSFTLKSVLIFLLTLVVSAFISRLVSFFASEHDPGSGQQVKKEKVGLGSWLLLVRIGIISAGLFLAFAAAGIPMDKVTIIVGALSVGIGFGLQTLINNLVSGLIIAFEKPVNVGDIVEIAGKSGRMKSIGFRSSVIATGEGSDVVIPNGDLLNEHLVNWTKDSSARRVEVIVNVAYGTNLQNTKEIIRKLLLPMERVLKYPEPVVNFTEFTNSGIQVKILFWVKYFTEWPAAKSDVIASINTTFKHYNIEIPIPQQEVHLHTFSDDQEIEIKREAENSKGDEEKV